MSEKHALIFQGGWDGHEPALVAKRFASLLEKHGYRCTISDTQDCLAAGSGAGAPQPAKPIRAGTAYASRNI